MIPDATIVVELPGAFAALLPGTLNPISRRVGGRGFAVTLAVPVEHASAVADALREPGHERGGLKILAAVRAVRPA